MVLDLILLISKKRRSPLIWGLFLFLASCSSKVPVKSADEASINLDEELNSLSLKVQEKNFGPTLKANAPFIDKTADYGLENVHAVAINAVDVNFDGKTDLVLLPNYYSSPKFYIFNPKEKKFELWKHDPLPKDFRASYLLFSDVNKDKVIDLIAGVLNQRSEVSQIPVKIYKGKIVKGLLTFEEDESAIKLNPEPSSSVSLIDYDVDGWIDIFIGNWFTSSKGQHFPSGDRLLRNVKGKFKEVTILREELDKTSNQLYPPYATPTYGSSTCDIDQNGYPDILTVSSSGFRNKLWMNLRESATGERYFQDYGPVSNYASDPNGSLVPTGGGRSFFSACTDYNNDGIMDVFVGELSHAYDNESVDKSSILTGSKTTFPPFFIRTEYLSDASSEAWNQGDRRGVWVDYNLDGKVDLLVDNSGFPPYSRLVLFEQDETHAFVNVASQLGIDIVNPTGTITIDLNDDGLPDIVTSQNNIRHADIKPRLYVFENALNVEGKKSIKIHLNGIKSNTQGIGAMVMLYTKQGKKKVVQRRWVEFSQGGLPSQNETGILFGIDQGTEVAGIKVRWPYIRKSGHNSGSNIEKLYSLKGFENKNVIEVTLCEDGKVLSGNISCQF